MAADTTGGASLSGKTAVVTGASRGIGRAIALRLAAAGADVMIAARSAEPLAAVAREIAEAGGHAEILALDLSDAASAGRLVDAAIDRFGRIDIVVNNAGGSVRGEFLDLSDSDWIGAYDLKLFGAMRLSRAAWPHLAKTQGSIINIVGGAGWVIPPAGVIAATQCAAYYALTKSMAELGLKEGVQVNAINPGPVRTGRLQAQLEAEGIDMSDPAAAAEGLAEAARKMNLRRIGEPEDIAALVAFILSPPGGLFHGSLIDFDGGFAKGL
jgi:NAD(P)-dependent dehydrogenase (short-subunit alcohol dehydrogenase family)